MGELKFHLNSARFITRACIYLTKNKQTEVINKNSEDLNQTKRMFWARVRKRTLSCVCGGGGEAIKEIIRNESRGIK